MKSLLDLCNEAADIKAEIDILITETNNERNPIDTRLAILADITQLHTRLNHVLHEIKQRRSFPGFSFS
jgi:hypothetical protein